MLKPPRSGQSAGVQESDIVSALNILATRFHAPDYAQTSLKQVRVLRAAGSRDLSSAAPFRWLSGLHEEKRKASKNGAAVY
jgi:hypothetical protein